MNVNYIITILNTITFIILGIFLLFGAHYIFFYFLTFKKVKKAPKATSYSRFAILVPARNESKVIHHIMNSLDKQTYPKEYFDVFFIVENEDDETIKIAKKHGYKSFIRTNLTDERRTKGFALQECINYINEQGLNYDAYMIFDADNVVEERYIEVMNNLRQDGVEVGIGYRNYTNANKNFYSSTSAILFCYMNNVTSKARTLLFKKGVLMGTGYFINKDIIDEAGGWIFTGMTEDTELTNYCYLHNINMRYTKEVCFYDEQAAKYRTWHDQLVRWIWGYFVRSKADLSKGRDHKSLPPKAHKLAIFEYRISFFPFVTFIVLLILLGITCFILGFIAIPLKADYQTLFFNGLLYLFLVAIIFDLQALGQIIREGKRIKIGFFYAIVNILLYWVYYINVIIAFFDGLIHPKKRSTWKVIQHKGEITNKKAKKRSV
ncbi:MAG: glycosyltransferase family 2 protein [Bacilli bacterium]|nr:glycosyltransferase family 2 protein [Bacilli bacterium]